MDWTGRISRIWRKRAGTSHFENLVPKVQALVFRSHPLASLLATTAFYVIVVLGFGVRLEISSNYFVILPVAAAALGYGLPGGLVAGLLGLPANLLLFWILGHPEFSPASKVIAEMSGICVGFLFGALSGYFEEVEIEMERRLAVERELREALSEKELLLRELNHRVRNNLNVVKSLIHLQASRSGNVEFKAAAQELISRVFAIALVHQELSRESGTMMVSPSSYLESLAANIARSLGADARRIEIDRDPEDRPVPVDTAINLGLIANEVLTRVLSPGSEGPEETPHTRLSVVEDEGGLRLRIESGSPALSFGRSADRNADFGLKLIDRIAASLRGSVEFRLAKEGEGGVFELFFPFPPWRFPSIPRSGFPARTPSVGQPRDEESVVAERP